MRGRLEGRTFEEDLQTAQYLRCLTEVDDCRGPQITVLNLSGSSGCPPMFAPATHIPVSKLCPPKFAPAPHIPVSKHCPPKFAPAPHIPVSKHCPPKFAPAPHIPVSKLCPPKFAPAPHTPVSKLCPPRFAPAPHIPVSKLCPPMFAPAPHIPVSEFHAWIRTTAGPANGDNKSHLPPPALPSWKHVRGKKVSHSGIFDFHWKT
eukprot:jgi/Botrbrau1/10370/Bobra.146_2s0009.1